MMQGLDQVYVEPKKTETLFARVKRPLGLLMRNPTEEVDEFTPDAR